MDKENPKNLEKLPKKIAPHALRAVSFFSGLYLLSNGIEKGERSIAFAGAGGYDLRSGYIRTAKTKN